MFVMGVVFELNIPEAFSLKDKRRVVKSLKDRLNHRFQMSVLETGWQEVWNRSQLGCSFSANHPEDLDQRLDRILEVVESTPQVELLRWTSDVIKVDFT